MKKFLSNIKNKYGLSTIFAALIIILGCTFFSTGFVRFYDGIEVYYFNAVYMRHNFVGLDAVTNFHIYLPSVCLILLNVAALFSSLIRKKFKLPTLALLAFPVLDFIMLFWVHGDCAYTVQLIREMEQAPGAHLTLNGYIYLVVCVVWALAVVWEYRNAKSGTEAPTPTSSEESSVAVSSAEDNSSHEAEHQD